MKVSSLAIPALAMLHLQHTKTLELQTNVLYSAFMSLDFQLYNSSVKENWVNESSYLDNKDVQFIIKDGISHL